MLLHTFGNPPLLPVLLLVPTAGLRPSAVEGKHSMTHKFRCWTSMGMLHDFKYLSFYLC